MVSLVELNQIQDHFIVEHKTLAVPSIDEPVLDEIFGEEDHVAAHRPLFVLVHGSRLQFEGEWDLVDADVFCQHSSDVILLLVEDDQLVLTIIQKHVDVDFILANNVRLHAAMVVETSQWIVDVFFVSFVGASLPQNRLELGRVSKLVADVQIKQISSCFVLSA